MVFRIFYSANYHVLHKQNKIESDFLPIINQIFACNSFLCFIFSSCLFIKFVLLQLELKHFNGVFITHFYLIGIQKPTVVFFEYKKKKNCFFLLTCLKIIRNMDLALRNSTGNSLSFYKSKVSKFLKLKIKSNRPNKNS